MAGRGAQRKANANPHTSPAKVDQLDVALGRVQLTHKAVEALRTRGFSNDELYEIVAPRRTLARRKEVGQNLTVAEADRVLRLERIADMADRVFGNSESGQRWLRKKSRVLYARPIDLLQSETGAELV